MGKIWKDKLDDLLKTSKQKLDERNERRKEAEKNQAEIRSRIEKQQAEGLRKQKIKEDRRRRQEERRRIRRETVNSRIFLVAKIITLVGVVIWACWFTTSFVYNYDDWVSKYHKWSIEYEAQEPARAEAKEKYEEKKRLESIAEEGRRAEEKRRVNEENTYREKPEEATYRGKSEEEVASHLDDVFNGMNMRNPNFDVGRYCLDQEKKGIITFRECMGVAVLKANSLK